ncbi:MAG: alkaline phosphatase family protein [Proteobacteria bacterium]|nr:alkaline phosphatase family protein [Pseudomonadota bacterium]
MTRLRRPAALVAALACALFGGTAGCRDAPETPSHVIVLSLDGLRHDAADTPGLAGLARMQREGARAERLTPVMPSTTFPNHVALATGTFADRHGIVDNRFLDRKRGLFAYENDASWLEAEPIWVAAERQGVRSAVFFWVGSESDWQGIGASDRRAPFDGAVGEDEKVDQILRWLDRPPPARPRLILSWWHGTDQVAHRRGADHPDVARQLAAQDRALARLLLGLDLREAWAFTTVLVVSDHGMTNVHESVSVEIPLREAGIAAEVVGGPAVAHVFLEDASDLEGARAVLKGVAGVEVHDPTTLPARWRLGHPDRTGDLIAVTSPPRTFVRPPKEGRFTLGMHGYDPELPDMGGSFLAVGRGVSPGTRLQRVHATQVAATVARLLDIDPPAHSEGEPIAGIVP